MTLVADNDAILKLCAYGLWDEACAVVGAAPEGVRTLVQAPFVLRRYRGQSRKVAQYGADGIDRALDAVARASPADLPDDRTDLDALLDAARRLDPVKPPIDPGEAALFVSAAHLGADGYLTTGDKRAVVALAEAAGADAVRDRLEGRVWCVEHLLYLLVEAHGVEPVQQRVRAVPACDKAVRNAFGVSHPAPREGVLDGLRSEVQDLRRRSGGLLVEL